MIFRFREYAPNTTTTATGTTTGTITNGKMNAAKRPRSPPGINSGSQVIIDLTSDGDDEAPPPKRARSHPPKPNSIPSVNPSSTNVPPTRGGRHTTPQSSNEHHRNSSESSKSKVKVSPFTNIPSWRKKSSDSLAVIEAIPIQFPVHSERRDQSKYGHDILQPSWQDRSTSTYQTAGNASQKDKHRNNIASSLGTGQQPPSVYDHASKSGTSQVGDGRNGIVSPVNGFQMKQAQPLKFDTIGRGEVSVTNHVLSKKVVDDRKLSHAPKIAKPPQTTHVASSRSERHPEGYRSHPNQGSRLKIEVRLPVRQSPSQSGPPRVTVSRNQVTPSNPVARTSNIVINLPPTQEALRKEKRRLIQEKLKLSTELAKHKSAEVERLLGLTGFSYCFTPASNEELKKIAQPKKRNIDRNTIRLPILGGRKQHVDPKQNCDSLQKFNFVHPREQAKAILTDRFGEVFNPPLTFSNDINDARLNGKFQFISQYILRGKIKSSTSSYIGQPGCNCVDSCRIDCVCLHKEFDDHFGKGDAQIQSYIRREDGLIVLTDEYINTHSARVEISECNNLCSCPSTCTNRVVQRGRTIPLEIFQTRHCGFGVRSSVKIVRGQFIEVYLGEVITENELSRREDAHEEGASSYVYSLDWFSAQSHYHVDGENFGSAMRYVNHSCEPNTKTFTVLNPTGGKSLHYVAFFAIKDIPPGEEVTIDYSPQEAGKVYDDRGGEDEDVVRCLCGADNCRRLLWRPGKERRSRKKIVGRVDE